jgi:hypothetical protein
MHELASTYQAATSCKQRECDLSHWAYIKGSEHPRCPTASLRFQQPPVVNVGQGALPRPHNGAL